MAAEGTVEMDTKGGREEDGYLVAGGAGRGRVGSFQDGIWYI